MPSPLLLSAKPVQEHQFSLFKKRAETIRSKRGVAPGLHVILVGNDPASEVYVKNKALKANELGFHSQVHRLESTATPAAVQSLVEKLNGDQTVDGILIQRPLPKMFNEEAVSYWVDAKKDVDAFHPENVGRLWLGLKTFAPCTPAGVMRLMNHYGISVAGKRACVIGRSSIVGKPMAALLIQESATVTVAHSKTNSLEEITQSCELIIVAAGKPGLVGARHIKKGSIVVDVGIHRDSSGKLVGDVNFEEVAPLASAITPVPGGVGPMTILELLNNTLLSAESTL